MQKIYLTSGHDYKIPLLFNVPEDAEMVVIASPGFGSSKDDGMMQMLLSRLPKEGIGAVTNDFPRHGESEASIDDLRLENCMDDLSAIETFVREAWPKAEIGYFGCSFGGFMSLYYLSTRNHKGKKAFYCSAALNMPDLLGTPTEENRKSGYVDAPETPPFTICMDFYDEMQKADLLGKFTSDKADAAMIYGGQDDEVPPALSAEFAKKHGIHAICIPEEGHYLNRRGTDKIIMKEMLAHFKG